MYTFDSRIRYSEVGEDGRLTINAIIDYMQDCTNFQSEDLGVGLEYHRKKQIMWVLNSWQIVVEQYPKMGERISVGTQSVGCEKMFGHRNFQIRKEDGSIVAKANSLWVLMDLKKGRPMIIPPEVGDVYGIHEPLEMDYAPRKIQVPEGGVCGESFVVQEYHLDTNHHVNNGQYVRMAMKMVPGDIVIKELRAEYKKQAMLGDEIIPVVSEADSSYFVSLNGVDGKAFSVVEFRY